MASIHARLKDSIKITFPLASVLYKPQPLPRIAQTLMLVS